MRIPKRYGESRVDHCVFCDRQSTAKNDQGLAVCITHRHAELAPFRCACGEYLDIRQGKWGAFFLCMNCGPINIRKAREINEVKDISKQTAKSEKEPAEDSEPTPERKPTPKQQKAAPRTETTIRSDDPLYFS
ncbi:MAG: hypothetical protein ABIC95_02375 [archaeon]